jgi:hypothetical protein
MSPRDERSFGSENAPDGFDAYGVSVEPLSGTGPGIDMTASLSVDGETIAETTEPRTEEVALQAGLRRHPARIRPPGPGESECAVRANGCRYDLHDGWSDSVHHLPRDYRGAKC